MNNNRRDNERIENNEVVESHVLSEEREEAKQKEKDTEQERKRREMDEYERTRELREIGRMLKEENQKFYEKQNRLIATIKIDPDACIIGNITAYCTYFFLFGLGMGQYGYTCHDHNFQLSPNKCYAAVEYKAGNWYVRNLFKREFFEKGSSIYHSDGYSQSVALTDNNNIMKNITNLDEILIVEYEMIPMREIILLYRIHRRNREITKALDKLMIKRRIQSRSIFFEKFCCCSSTSGEV